MTGFESGQVYRLGLAATAAGGERDAWTGVLVELVERAASEAGVWWRVRDLEFGSGGRYDVTIAEERLVSAARRRDLEREKQR